MKIRKSARRRLLWHAANRFTSLDGFKRGNDEARVNGVNGSAVVGRSLHYRGLSKKSVAVRQLILRRSRKVA